MINTPPDRLAQMLLMQETLQTHTYGGGIHPANLIGRDKMAYISVQALALTDEVHEVLAETGWKPWATSNHINGDAYRAEIVDAWHFFMNLMLAVGMTPEELYEGYMAKHQKNIQRQADGYDGVSTKCPACKRAYDDAAVKCHPKREAVDKSLNDVPAWCDVHQDFIPRILDQHKTWEGCQHVGCKIRGMHEHKGGVMAAPEHLTWADRVAASQGPERDPDRVPALFELPGLGIMQEPSDYFKGRAA